MKFDEKFMLVLLEKALNEDYLKLKDHRNNLILLEKGVFSVNGVVQVKSKDVIKSIFLEALKLSRLIEFDNNKYQRKGSKWNIKVQ